MTTAETSTAEPAGLRHDTIRVVVAGVVLSALAWIDPLFVPLVLLGPIATGVAWAVRRQSWRGPAMTWAIAGVGMLLSDWIINDDDQLFHLILTLVMVGLLRLAHAVTSLPLRRSSHRPQPQPGDLP